jgi:S-adenosylmethionine hydrolase
VVVDPGVGSKRKAILVRTKNYFFVAPDNGVLSLALKEERPLEIIEISNEKYFLKPVSCTFHGRDVFAPACAHISKGVNTVNFGRHKDALQKLDLPKIRISIRQLCGEIIYIDRFGNLVSNVDEESLNVFSKKKELKICIKNRTIDGLSQGYFEGVSHRPVALIDSFGYLEIAVNGDSASRILRAGKGERVKVILK